METTSRPDNIVISTSTVRDRCATFADALINYPHVTFIFWLALISNAILALLLPSDIAWRTEATRIAASIAEGQGFSSPFVEPSGPSAWIPPLYPYVLAGIFHIFGTFTLSSYWVAVAVNIIVHALTCVLLYRSAGEAFGPRVGWYSGCALASLPLLSYPLVLLHVLGGYGGRGLFISPNIIGYTYFAEFVIILLIWLTLRHSHWGLYGAAWGVATLVNPTVLAFAPAFLLWLIWQRENWRYVGLTLAVAVLCMTPWIARNYLVFHRFVLIRGNLGVELKVGNQPGQRGLWKRDVHPDGSASELSRLINMGEVEYCKAAWQETVSVIRMHPGEYLRSTLSRVGYWWIGNPMSSRRLGYLQFLKYLPAFLFSALAISGAVWSLRFGNPKGLLFVTVLGFYPLVYYLTHTYIGFRYQHPIQPEMLALATWVTVEKSR